MWLVMRAPFLAIGSLAICTRISWPGFSRSEMIGRSLVCADWRRAFRPRPRRSRPRWRSLRPRRGAGAPSSVTTAAADLSSSTSSFLIAIFKFIVIARDHLAIDLRLANDIPDLGAPGNPRLLFDQVAQIVSRHHGHGISGSGAKSYSSSSMTSSSTCPSPGMKAWRWSSAAAAASFATASFEASA